MGGFLLGLIGAGLLGYHLGHRKAERQAWCAENGEWRGAWSNGAPWARRNRELRQGNQHAYEQGPREPSTPATEKLDVDVENYWKRQAAESSVLDTAEGALNKALEQVAAFRRQYGNSVHEPPVMVRRPSSTNLRDV